MTCTVTTLCVFGSITLQAIHRGGVSPVFVLKLALEGGRWFKLRLRLLRLLKGRARGIFVAASAVHMGMSFVEAGFFESFSDRTTKRAWLVGIEAAVLAVYWVGVVAYVFVHRLHVDYDVADHAIGKLFIGNRRRRFVWGGVRIALVVRLCSHVEAVCARRNRLEYSRQVAMTWDWIIRVVAPYETGPSGEFDLPYSSLLRPALVVVQSSSLRTALSHFRGTLSRSRNLGVLWVSFITLSAVGSMLLLQGKLAEPTGFGRGFDGATAVAVL